MSAYRQILYHIVFRTKGSEKTINQAHSADLYKYIWGIVKNKKCVLFRINGMEEHIHILSDLHPSVALAGYIRDIKVSSAKWMKESGFFPDFRGWGIKYCALTYSYKERDTIINYIKNQQEHHKQENFQDEIRRFFKEQATPSCASLARGYPRTSPSDFRAPQLLQVSLFSIRTITYFLK